MAYTFLKAQGKEIGLSLLEEDKIDFAKNYLKVTAIKLFTSRCESCERILK